MKYFSKLMELEKERVGKLNVFRNELVKALNVRIKFDYNACIKQYYDRFVISILVDGYKFDYGLFPRDDKSCEWYVSNWQTATEGMSEVAIRLSGNAREIIEDEDAIRLSENVREIIEDVARGMK